MRRSIVVAALTSTLGAAAAPAQQAPPVRASLGAGLHAFTFDGWSPPPGLFAQGGALWQRRGSRVGALASVVAYDWRQDRTFANASGCDGWCRSARRSTMGGVLLEGKLDLSRGAFRPYLLGGGGLVVLSFSSRINFRCNVVPPGGGGPRCVSLAEGTARSGDVRPLAALAAGMGGELPAGRVRLFAEARALMIGDQNVGDGGGSLLPIVFGVRF